MTRSRVSTTVDEILLRDARRLAIGATDAALSDETLRALLRHHRTAERDAAYAAPDIGVVGCRLLGPEAEGRLYHVGGFIEPDDGGKDLFVHHSAITGSGYKSLEDGAKVEYEEEQGPKGPNAANVRSI